MIILIFNFKWLRVKKYLNPWRPELSKVFKESKHTKESSGQWRGDAKVLQISSYATFELTEVHHFEKHSYTT